VFARRMLHPKTVHRAPPLSARPSPTP
jgi:hypothetical protein